MLQLKLRNKKRGREFTHQKKVCTLGQEFTFYAK